MFDMMERAILKQALNAWRVHLGNSVRQATKRNHEFAISASQHDLSKIDGIVAKIDMLKTHTVDEVAQAMRMTVHEAKTFDPNKISLIRDAEIVDE